MSYCLNPRCQNPRNPPKTSFCQSCGSKLLLKDRYRALKPIGRGGFGRTYLAVDEDRLNSPCVIKQLLPRLQGSSASKQAALEKAIQLFQQEALRLYQLGEHPQIPCLLASFEQDKLLYLVQEFIDGQTLWDHFKEQGVFSDAQIVEVLGGILPVLEFVHEKGVVHRDITPVNILRRKRNGFLVLIDFGVAKQLTQTSMAKTGTRIGTEGYAPIEQIRSGKAYPASDLYSLGVTCLHLLTGMKPERLFDPIDGCVWRKELVKQGREISDRVGNILDKMVKDRVSDRYESAKEVLADLSEIAAGTPRYSTVTLSTPTADPRSALPRSVPSVPPPQSEIPQPIRTKQPQHTGGTFLSQPQSDRPKTPRSISTSQGRKGYQCMHTLTGHSSWVTCLAISPNGSVLASGSLDDKIILWNLYAGEPLRTLCGHYKSVNALAISSDGKMLASCSDDVTVKLWRIDTGTELVTLHDHLRDINSVAFIPKGNILASASEDRTIKLWQLATRPDGEMSASVVNTLAGRSGIIKAIAIDPQGQILASGGLDNSIHIWQLNTSKMVHTLCGHFQSINAVAMTADGKMLASGSKDKTIKLWNLGNGSLLATLSGHTDMVNSVVFSPGGKILVSGSSDNTIKLWRVSDGKLLGTIAGHTGAVNAVAIAPDGKTLISGSSDETLKIWQRMS